MPPLTVELESCVMTVVVGMVGLGVGGGVGSGTRGDPVASNSIQSIPLNFTSAHP